MDLRFRKKREVSKITDTDETDSNDRYSDLKDQTLNQKVIEFFDVPIYIMFYQFLPYLFYIGVRAVPLWIIINLGLTYYEPQEPLWIISIAIAQVAVVIRYIKVEDKNRIAFFLVIAICAIIALNWSKTPPYYGFFHLVPVMILLICPFYFWVRRDDADL